MKIYGGMKKIPSKMHYYLNKKDLFKGIWTKKIDSKVSFKVFHLQNEA
jgi:hypothetical protein